MIFLETTLDKELKLTNMLFVLEIKRNFISGTLLYANGFKMVMESRMLFYLRMKYFLGKGYVKDDMFKINVTAIKKCYNKEKSNTYMLESCNLWYNRLGHLNFKSSHRLIHLDYILKFNFNSKYKYEICVEAKKRELPLTMLKESVNS